MIYVIQQLSGWYVCIYIQNSLNNFISRHLVPKYQHFLNNSTKSLLQHCIANKIESYTIHAGFCIVVYILLYIEFKSKQRTIHFLMKSAFKCDVIETKVTRFQARMILNVQGLGRIKYLYHKYYIRSVLITFFVQKSLDRQQAFNYLFYTTYW